MLRLVKVIIAIALFCTVLTHLWLIIPIIVIGVPVIVCSTILGFWRIIWYGGKNLKERCP